jgi:S1-C subfamily serine protease
VSDAPDYDQPWQTRGATSSSGSGAIVETRRGMRVLTNAHCVENHVFVEVRRYGNAKRYTAKVQLIGHECDLALLDIEDPDFFHNTEPIELGPLPELSDRVSVCGYPVGGERLSITEGIVSRIEVLRYEQRRRHLLAIQIDAAINAGNSGGPVLMDGQLVGVAFQTLEDAEKIGYMVAGPVIEHFLRDVEEDGRHGFPSLGVRTQKLESDAHRRMLGLPASGDGILVSGVAYGGSAWGRLREGDVILEIDGAHISSEGTVPLRDGEPVSYDYLVSNRRVGETANVRVWRDRGELNCVVPLKPPTYLVAEDLYDVRPSFYVFGGLLFVPLTRDYLKTWGEQWSYHAPRDLVSLYEKGLPSRERVQPVVLQKVLADRVNQGYHDLESVLIDKVQGVRVRSLRHLVAVVETSREDYLHVTACDGRQIVVDCAAARARGPAILARFGVPRDRSADLGSAANADQHIQDHVA